jgi:hypothetical protein
LVFSCCSNILLIFLYSQHVPNATEINISLHSISFPQSHIISSNFISINIQKKKWKTIWIVWEQKRPPWVSGPLTTLCGWSPFVPGLAAVFNMHDSHGLLLKCVWRAAVLEGLDNHLFLNTHFVNRWRW